VRRDPFLSYRFVVLVKDLVVAGFSDVTGLQAEVEVFEYREGGRNDFVHRRPGPARYPSNLSLRRGLGDLDNLWGWHQDVVAGRVVRRNVSIVLVHAEGAGAWTWTFRHAYPVRWLGPDLNATSATVAFETLELAHEGVERRSSGSAVAELGRELLL
jgi:phage tail-like protein